MNDFDFSELHDGHRNRLRQRALRDGLDDFHPHEVVELLLYPTDPRQDMNEMAHILLNRFASVKGLLEAGREELTAVEGLNTCAVEWLCMFQELSRACMDAAEQKPPVYTNCAQTFHLALKLKAYYPPTCAVQLFLDAGSHLIAHKKFCDSPRWGEPEALSDAVGDAIASDGKDFIILLYTRQKSPVPSFYDIAHARSYSQVLHAARGTLLDVVLVGEKNMASMRLLRLIRDYNFSEKKVQLREDYAAGADPDQSIEISDFE